MTPVEGGHSPTVRHRRSASVGKFLYRAVFAEEPGAGGELKEVEYDTAEEALRHACRDLRAGYRPVGIWAPDRALLHSAAAIRLTCGQGD